VVIDSPLCRSLSFFPYAAAATTICPPTAAAAAATPIVGVRETIALTTETGSDRSQ
jgi:hypothetical protein